MRQTVFTCTFVIMAASFSAAMGADPGAGAAGAAGAAGGIGRSIAGGASSAAQLERGAGIRIGGGAAANAAARPVGPNFGAARVGAEARFGAGLQPGRATPREFGPRNGSADANRRGDPGRPERTPAEVNSAERRSEEARDPRVQAAMRADLALATRLAEIDRLRDIALTKGDLNMLERADALEFEARAQHEQRVRNSFASETGRQNSEFGLSTAARARAEGRDFGQTRAAEAREEGRAFQEGQNGQNDRVERNPRAAAQARFELEANYRENGREQELRRLPDAEERGSSAEPTPEMRDAGREYRRPSPPRRFERRSDEASSRDQNR